MRDDLPYDVFVYTQVVVNDLVTHPDDVRPRNLGMLVRESRRHLSRRFTDDLDEMNQCEAEILVRVELFRESPCVLPTAFLDMSSMCPT